MKAYSSNSSIFKSQSRYHTLEADRFNNLRQNTDSESSLEVLFNDIISTENDFDKMKKIARNNSF